MNKEKIYLARRCLKHLADSAYEIEQDYDCLNDCAKAVYLCRNTDTDEKIISGCLDEFENTL